MMTAGYHIEVSGRFPIAKNIGMRQSSIISMSLILAVFNRPRVSSISSA